MDQPAILRTQLDQLADLARALLPRLVDEASGLYAQKAVWRSNRVEPLGSSPLYSAISAIGIEHDGEAPELRATLAKTLDTLDELALRGSSRTALLATTIWALALRRDERAPVLLHRLDGSFSAPPSSSMELGLVLAAVAAVVDAFPQERGGLRLATTAREALLARFEDSAQLFSGTSTAFRPRHRLQQNLTSFASQVYPLHGLAELARVTGGELPPEALRSAARLVEAQGPLGQWWWIYSARNGEVLDGYPVYSVHQHAMAFMGLAPLERLGGPTYRSELAKGLSWLFGDNELRLPLVDRDRRFIARCIQRRGADADGPSGMSRSQWRRVLLASWRLRSPPGVRHDGNLELLEECRPYELGWLLYARSLLADDKPRAGT